LVIDAWNTRARQPAAQSEGAVGEGCTPADARMLRRANHGLADENAALIRLLRAATPDEDTGCDECQPDSDDQDERCHCWAKEARRRIAEYDDISDPPVQPAEQSADKDALALRYMLKVSEQRVAALEAQIKAAQEPKATHSISACYFPKKGEVELSWEDLETHKQAFLTTTVTPEFGNSIATVVPACVYWNAALPTAPEGMVMVPEQSLARIVNDGPSLPMLEIAGQLFRLQQWLDGHWQTVSDEGTYRIAAGGAQGEKLP